jgi:thioredoxin 1
VITVTDATFAAEVLNSTKPVLVEYWAEWCGPCRMVGPVLAEIAAEHADEVTVAKLDIDTNPVTAQNYQIMAAPTMILYSGGKPVASAVGARPKSALLTTFAPHFKS